MLVQENFQKRITIDEVPDIYYVSKNFKDSILNQKYVPKSELNNLIDEYLKVLDDLILELQKGQETKDRNKEYKVSVHHQKPINPNQYETNISRICRQSDNEIETVVNIANIINDATKSAKAEKIIHLALQIKVLAQEACLEMPYLPTVTKALNLYFVPESLEKNDGSNSIIEEKVLKEKDSKLDLEDLIDDYLKVVKSWSSEPKESKFESSYPQRLIVKQERTYEWKFKLEADDNDVKFFRKDKNEEDKRVKYKTEKLIGKENLDYACNSWIERVSQLRRIVK
ncbi:34444_t:CDS:2 [Gigaspora margarita]|uniref:34444_t:CDS:1 n=1 Tax=Gigaspora margarita TaxID=4874 RepID=A0ABN7W454_GIGMA|nr:34444_t:CDS:2 [Gigaspora margarita]